MRSARAEKFEAAAVALAAGILAGFSKHSGVYGFGVGFAIYTVIMLDFILDRLDDLKKKTDDDHD
jgi:hypothetical protein